MRILFVHQNFPAQFQHLARHLAREAGHEVFALSLHGKEGDTGARLVRYELTRGTSRNIQPWVADFESKAIRGEACVRAARKLRDAGFVPDVIYAHAGWGEALFLRDVFPASALLTYAEFYYRASGQDVGFDPEFPLPDADEPCRIRARNAHNLLTLEASDMAIAPTLWQRHTYPERYRELIEVVHDGIDTRRVAPNLQARISLDANQAPLQPGDEVISFVSRNLEPYRGYHVFMRALPEILRRRPRARAVIVGGDGTSYGAKPTDGVSWKQRFLREVKPGLDMTRVHFVGQLPYDAYLALLQVSACHVYLTYPFVLSWSCIEALAAGCLVVGSATPPVQEVIGHGRNGLLVDFFDVAALANSVVEALAAPAAMRPLRAAARAEAVQRYDLHQACLSRQLALIKSLATRAGS